MKRGQIAIGSKLIGIHGRSSIRTITATNDEQLIAIDHTDWVDARFRQEIVSHLYPWSEAMARLDYSPVDFARDTVGCWATAYDV